LPDAGANAGPINADRHYRICACNCSGTCCFTGTAVGAVLFTDGGIEGQGGDRQSNEIKQYGQRRSRERHFLSPFAAHYLEHSRRQRSVIAASKGILFSIICLMR
jgi:hypothetical protein